MNYYVGRADLVLLVTDPVLESVVLLVPSLSLASLLKSVVEGWSGPLEVTFVADWTGRDERLLFHYLLHIVEYTGWCPRHQCVPSSRERF